MGPQGFWLLAFGFWLLAFVIGQVSSDYHVLLGLRLLVYKNTHQKPTLVVTPIVLGCEKHL